MKLDFVANPTLQSTPYMWVASSNSPFHSCAILWLHKYSQNSMVPGTVRRRGYSTKIHNWVFAASKL